MGKNVLLIGNREYSMDCYKTQVNNNVIIVGATGAGKTRGIVIPNLLQATGSYIVSDPKGNLYDKYAETLRVEGYRVDLLDFTNPNRSTVHYNPLNYVRCEQDISKIANIIMSEECHGNLDPFWTNVAIVMLESIIGYLVERKNKRYCNLKMVQSCINRMRPDDSCYVNDADYADDVYTHRLDIEHEDMNMLFNEHEKIFGETYAVRQFKSCMVAASKTLRSVQIMVNSKIGHFQTKELCRLLSSDDINIRGIGDEKRVLFVGVSDTDRSMDSLANIFYMQAMNELCQHADFDCEDNRLPVPVRFILDDFATNVKINDFPRIISSIRSRGISTMLIIQAESQLDAAYGADGKTIITNCDTYVYLGGNDIDTAREIATRVDTSLSNILYMPIGKMWVFRRGKVPEFMDIYTNSEEELGEI